MPHEFKYSADYQRDTIRSSVHQLAQQKYVLCVGTIETRKNTLGLLQAWCEIQKSRPADMPMLVISGGRGRGADGVHAFLRQTGNVSGTVTVIGKPNDAELEYLYQHCQFTVFPSLFEGWGLPIGESLWFGKPVICADNASMPEAGGQFATYFSHSQPGSLQAVLERMIDHPVKLPENIRDHLATWDDTAAALYRAIDALDAAPPPGGVPARAMPESW
jgi:glycosyltransferase involved in cell wall biosynthesis